MPAKVTLEILDGPLGGRTEVFAERMSTIIGRGPQCRPRLTDDDLYLTVSRHHCLLDVNPPQVRIRDLGSMNGTYVNGRKIGQREADESPEDAASRILAEYDLKDGDSVRIGDVGLKVGIATTGTTRSAGSGREHCASCGGTLQAAGGAADDLLCSTCRGNPVAALKALVAEARRGEPGAAPLRGLKIVKTLGRGTTGAVYLARRLKTGEQLALKILLPAVAAESWITASFLREVRNTQALNHPNVVRLFDSGGHGGLFFYTMEFCPGGTVDELRDRRGGRLPLGLAVPIVLQALDGLGYVHQAEIPQVKLADGRFGKGRGIVHRDLKPANIFIGRGEGKSLAKIADVGVGKAFDTAGLSGLTRTGSVAGTPVVTPRQQVINFKYARPDVDVWAMAATLYNLLTGQYPRDFPPDQDPWRVVLETDPVPIRRRDPSVPEPLARVIDRALIDNPEITIRSAVELKSEITSALKKSR